VATNEPTITRLNKEQWIAALRRSPKAKGMLHQLTQDGDPNETIDAYCCLGVLSKEEGALLVGPDKETRLWFPTREHHEADDEWRWSSQHEEEYKGHPTLTHGVQSILISLNDLSDDFETWIIPAIELLLNDDLSLQERHRYSTAHETNTKVTALHYQMLTDGMKTRTRYAERFMDQLLAGATLPEIRVLV
jgi:hypothetical protein